MPSYRSYAFQRIFHGIAMYLLMVLSYSVVFNGIAEKTLRAQVKEETSLLLRENMTLSSTEYAELFEKTELEKLHQYHLDEPSFMRILWRSWDVLTLHFGHATSLRSAQGGRAALRIVFESIPNTLVLFGAEAVLVFFLGGLVGLFAARKPGGLLDRVISFLPMLLNGLPLWWIGMLAMMLFSYTIPLFPSGGIRSNPAPEGLKGLLDYVWHLTLPLLTIVALNLWNASWQVRNLILGTFKEEYITAARSRGVREGRLLIHAIVATQPALATIVILGLLQSLTGNILVEGVFNWPGMGSLFFAAVQQGDVPVLMTLLSVQTMVNLVGMVFLDLAYAWLDPRIRLGGIS